MIRFRCQHCGKTLKASGAKAGASFVCPRCKERSTAPAGDSDDAFDPWAGPEESSRRAQGPEQAVALRGGQTPSLFSGMSPRLRGAVALVAGAGVLSLVLAVVAPLLPSLAHLAESATSMAMLLVPSSAILVFVLLHAHGTGCPACGRWWARTKVETEFVDREVIDKDGVPFARSTYRTIYECPRCQHRWSAAFTDEYKEFIREQPNRQGLESGRSGRPPAAGLTDGRATSPITENPPGRGDAPTKPRDSAESNRSCPTSVPVGRLKG